VKLCVSLALSAVTCVVVLVSPSTVAAQATVNDPNLSVSSIVAPGGLSLPTGFRFLGASPNDLFAIEKDTGRVQRVTSGVVSTVLDLNVSNDS